MELDTLQLLIIGAVASIVTQLLKLLAARLGYEVPRWIVTIVLYVVSAALAFFFLKPVLPDPNSPTFIPDLIALATTVLGAATVIYNIILDKVFPSLRMTVERQLAKG